MFVSNGLAAHAPGCAGGEQAADVDAAAKMGLVNGRIQRIARAVGHARPALQGEGHRLADTDFDRRFGELVTAARAANVSFYPVGVPVCQCS